MFVGFLVPTNFGAYLWRLEVTTFRTSQSEASSPRVTVALMESKRTPKVPKFSPLRVLHVACNSKSNYLYVYKTLSLKYICMFLYCGGGLGSPCRVIVIFVSCSPCRVTGEDVYP